VSDNYENPASIRGKTAEDIRRRRVLAENITEARLEKLGSFTRNIENMIGCDSVLFGFAVYNAVEE